MKITCTNCEAQYTIADEKVPAQGARVRCRKCQGVFTIQLAPPAAPPPASAAPAGAAPPPAPTDAAPRGVLRAPFIPPAAGPPPTPPEIRPVALPTIPPAGTALSPTPRPETVATSSPIPEGLPPEERTRHERARRLARVLASDIAIYNQEKRERGLRDGNLVAVLGYEIKKSWETYKERVTPELANATPYFRDALNEMLAGGQKIF
jgi:predicted Zn finger-like uncharacterized protein